MWNRGELAPWCKGKTKDSDPRIYRAAVKSSNTVMTNRAERKKRSSRMRECRLSKVIPDLTGSAHPQWKGGVAAVQPFIRSRLNRAWTFKIMKRDGYTCQGCGSMRHLCVHHDSVSFSDILQRIIAQNGISNCAKLSFDEKDNLAQKVIDYHIQNAVSGITLCWNCHNSAHGGKLSWSAP